MDTVDICDGVELCLDGCRIYLSKEGKEALLVSDVGKIYNNLFYLFDQYLAEHEYFSNFEDNVKTQNQKKLFMNLNILEKKDGYLVVLSDCGNVLVDKIIEYISNNQDIYDSMRNLSYLNIFNECLKIFDSVPVSPPDEMLEDGSYAPDSTGTVEPLPVDQIEAEDDMVLGQGRIDAPDYPLSEKGIELAIGRDCFLSRDGDRLVVTDKGRKNETFMLLYGNKIDTVNSLMDQDMPEEVSDMEDSEKIYYTFGERTDKYNGVSIFFEGNEVPIVTLKRYGKVKKMLLSPQIYALNIICMADKMGIELTKDLLESKLEKFAHDSTKHWSSLLEVDGCIIYDNGKLLPGQKLRDVVDLANIYLDGRYESFEKPIQIKSVSYARIKRVLTREDDFSISGDQTVSDIEDYASNGSQVQFSDSRSIDGSGNNKSGKFIVSVDEPGGISHIESSNGDLTIIYDSPDGSCADEGSLPVKKLQINGNFTPAGNSIRMDNGNSADSIVNVLKEFGLLDDGNLNEYGEELSEKMGIDWNSILTSE